MKLQSLGFIGGGRITQLLLKALKQKNSLPERILIADPDEEMKSKVKSIDDTFIQCVQNNFEVLNVDVLFLAVHPPLVKQIAEQINGKIKIDTIVISLVPVISIEKLSTMLGVQKLVRIIPNAASVIHKGYNPVVYSNEINTEIKQQLQNLFNNWGEAPEVDENKLEAYAIVTAMGATYFWFQWLKLKELGKQFGLTEPELEAAIPALLHGATETLFESNIPLNDVLDLIPVKPLEENEDVIKNIFDEKLTKLYTKLTQT